MAIALDEVPVDALAAELGSNRNAVYKALFDARRKLRASLARAGYAVSATPELQRATRHRTSTSCCRSTRRPAIRCQATLEIFDIYVEADLSGVDPATRFPGRRRASTQLPSLPPGLRGPAGSGHCISLDRLPLNPRPCRPAQAAPPPQAGTTCFGLPRRGHGGRLRMNELAYEVVLSGTGRVPLEETAQGAS